MSDTLLELRYVLDMPVQKHYRDGTHRQITPAATVERLRPLLASMGITRVANVTGLDWVGLPVVMVCRPNARSLAVSQGKGLTLDAARASGIMESIELYHAEHLTLPLILGSSTELRRTHRLVDVAELPRTTASRFQPDLPLLWTEGYDLLNDETVWLPYELVNMNTSVPQPSDQGCFLSTSNGLASGNHLLEAISHAICEVVERDATTLWHLLSEQEQRCTRIDLSTIGDPSCAIALDKLERAGMDVMVWDMTADTGIPVFLCMIAERTEDPARLLYTSSGMGAHPARHVALLRAITEAAQSRLTLIAGSRDDVFRDEYHVRGRITGDVSYYRNLLNEDGTLRDFRDVPSQEGATFNVDIAWELSKLRAAGIKRVIAIDLTRPEYRLPVVRVVIPGLEGPDKVPGYRHGTRARQRRELSA